MPGKCRTTCKKRRYETEVDAMLALDRVQRQRDCDNLTKHEVRHYWCEEHQAFHLTSMKETTTCLRT